MQLTRTVLVLVSLAVLSSNGYSQAISIDNSTNLTLKVDGLASLSSFTLKWTESLNRGWYYGFYPYELWTTQDGMLDFEVPRYFSLAFQHGDNEFSLVPSGTNSGVNPLAAGEGYYDEYEEVYHVEVDAPLLFSRTHINNLELARVFQWGIGCGYLMANSRSIVNLKGELQELVDMDDISSEFYIDYGRLKVVEGRELNPVCEFSMYGAMVYCNLRSEMEGLSPCYNLDSWECNFSAEGYRLPTEEEWEYAARGGLNGTRFPWGDTTSHSNANYKSVQDKAYDLNPSYGCIPEYYIQQDSSGYSASNPGAAYTASSPCRAFQANGYGLYDMVGNVSVWCLNADGTYKTRGGNFGFSCSKLRIGHRGRYTPPQVTTDNLYGFRIVRKLP